MKIYSGSGQFNATAKTATIQICLPEPVNPLTDKYLYQYKNISTTSYNGLVVFVKKISDSGADLSGYTLNHEGLSLNLDTVSPHSGDSGTASEFIYTKNFVLLIHHEANTGEYDIVAKQLFQNLNTIANTGMFTLTASATSAGPKKTGTGTLIKM